MMRKARLIKTWGSGRRFRFYLLLFLAFALSGLALAQTKLSPREDLIARSREAYNDRRFAEAGAAYKEYLDTYPDGPDRDEAGFFYGHCLFLQRDYRGAEEIFSREEARNKKYEDQIIYYRGEIANVNHSYDLALIYYDRLLGEFPGSKMTQKAKERSAEVHYKRANQYVVKGALSLALQDYLLAQGGPADLEPVVQYKLGRCYEKLIELDKAAELFGQLAVNEAPTALDAARLARYRLARLLEDRASFAEAEVNYQAFLTKAPSHFLASLAREGLARVWARQGKTDQAFNYWKEQGQGKNIAALSETYHLALNHYLHEEYRDALQSLTQLLPQVTNQEFLWKVKVWLARIYLKMERPDKARTFWKDVIQDQTRMNHYLLLEYARFALPADPAGALAAAKKVAETASGLLLEEAAYVMTLAKFKLNSPETLAAAAKYLLQYPQGRFVGPIALLRGRLFLGQGDWTSAEADFALCMQKHPDPEQRLAAALELARLYQLEGRPDSALEVLAKAQALAQAAPSPGTKAARAEAEVLYGKGDYGPGIKKYEALCAAPHGCAPDDLFRLFWGYYRGGRFPEADQTLTRLAGLSDPAWSFRAGFWRGVMALEKGDAAAAAAAMKELQPADELDQGFWLWETAKVQLLANTIPEAVKTLTKVDKAAPGAALYTKGEIIKAALKANDLSIYLAGLPPAEEMDQETLSESALLNLIRQKAAANATAGQIEPLNRALRLEAITEDAVEEGNFWEARSKIYGPKREEAFAMMDRHLARSPNSPFAAEIKFYHGEDSFQKKDYQGTISWLKDVKPEQVPDNLRYHFYYYLGESYKIMRNLDAMRPLFLAVVQNYLGQEGEIADWREIGLGLVLVREFNPAIAVFDYVTANSKDPKVSAEMMYWKGMAQTGNGNPQAARETFLALARNFPDQGMWVTTALYEAAGISVQMGEYDEALKLYNQVLARTKGDEKTSTRVKAKIAEVKKLKSLSKGEPKPK